MYHRKVLPIGTEVKIDGLDTPALVHKTGMVLTASDGQTVSIFSPSYKYKCINVAS